MEKGISPDINVGNSYCKWKVTKKRKEEEQGMLVNWRLRAHSLDKGEGDTIVGTTREPLGYTLANDLVQYKGRLVVVKIVAS